MRLTADFCSAVWFQFCCAPRQNVLDDRKHILSCFSLTFLIFSYFRFQPAFTALYVCQPFTKHCIVLTHTLQQTIIRMWANAQCDGRPLFNAAVWLTPTTRMPCNNAGKKQNPLKLPGVPKFPNWSQPLVGQSSPYCGEDIWKRYSYLTSFFPIFDMCLSFKDMARQSCAMVRRWWFLAIFCVLHFKRAACSTFQTCILNSH